MRAVSSDDREAIRDLISSYAWLVDDGDLAGVADLLARAVVIGGDGPPVSGRSAIEQSYRDVLVLHEDGTPRTRHVISGTLIDVDADGARATARSYFTALQAVSGLPLQPVASGRYFDCFVKDQQGWYFIERRISTDLVGDLSHHIAGAI